MDGDDIKALESEEEWEEPEEELLAQPRRRPRAVVSVAFPREDFEVVEECAERLGKRLSEFIREAAIARAKPRRGSVTYQGFGGTSDMVVSVEQFVITAVDNRVREEPDMPLLTARGSNVTYLER